MPDYTTNDPRGWCGDPARGAAMGRPTIKGNYTGQTLSIVRKQLDGDYDENGTYFGGGPGTKPLFWVSSEDGEFDYMLRARNIDDARAQVIAAFPNAQIAGDTYDVSLDDKTLQELLDGEVESCEAGPNVVASLNDEIRTAAREYEVAVLKTLETWIDGNLGFIELDGFDVSEIGLLKSAIVRKLSHLSGGAAYLYYMEAESAGIGTWDGDWDCMFKSALRPVRETIRILSGFVKRATAAEYQKLHMALMIRAEESVPEDEDDD